MTVKTDSINDIRLRYRSPEVRVIEVKTQHVLCISNPDAYITEMEEGDDNW